MTRSPVDVVGGDVRFGLAGARRLSGRTWLTAEIGPGLDFVDYTPAFQDGAIRASESRLDVRPFAYAALGVRSSVGSMSIAVAGLVAVGLQRTHYDVAIGNRISEVLVPAPVQPGFSAGVLW